MRRALVRLKRGTVRSLGDVRQNSGKRCTGTIYPNPTISNVKSAAVVVKFQKQWLRDRADAIYLVTVAEVG